MLKVNEYGGRQTKVNEKRQCFKGWETLVILGISFSSLKESVFIRLRLTLFKYFLVCQEIQESDSQYSEFVFLAVDIITYNDNLTEVVID